MDKNSNKYILMYAAILTVIVAVSLAVLADGLRPAQQANQIEATKADILRSVGAEYEDVNTYFEQTITGVVINSQGDVVEGEDAMSIDPRVQNAVVDETQRLYPLFIYSKEDGDGGNAYIIPLAGSGLWDIIWGYLAVDEDMNTILGASFDHQAETPGLGAEITSNSFQNAFVGKEILDNGEFVGVTVKKGAITDPEHEVQAISGATITGDGVTEMIKRDVAKYIPYFEKIKNN